MGFILHIALAIAALALAESGVVVSTEVPLAVLVFAAVPHALSWIDRRLFVRGRFRLAGAFYAAVSWSPPVLFACAVLACGWAATVERLVGARPAMLGWPHPAVLVALVPFVGYTWLAIDARARVGDARTTEIARARRFQGRMFLSALAPLVLFVAVSWLVGLDRRVRVNIEYVALWGGVFTLALVAAAVVLLPWLLRRTWDTAPMPAGSMRAQLEAFARGIGFQCRELVVWNTGLQMANAAVVGVGRGKLVMFSDLLLAQLPPRELLAVFAHEIGHVAKHHVLVFVAWSLAFFIGIDLALAWLAPENEWVAFALLGLALLGWYLAFGYFSRRSELDADLHSIAVTGDIEAMVHALELVGSPHTRRLGSWRHFSTEKRVAYLRAVQLDPRPAARMQRTLTRIGRIGLALALLAIAAEAWTLSRSFGADRVYAELALGDDRSASERLRGVEAPGEGLVRLVALANALPSAAVPPERMRARGDTARARGDLQRAADLYTLAQLRGASGLDAVLAELADELRAGRADQ